MALFVILNAFQIREISYEVFILRCCLVLPFGNQFI